MSKYMWCADLLLGNIFIQFGTKLYRQVVGIPIGTNCAPLVANLFLFCYERDFMMSLSDDKQADVIDEFNTTSSYLDDILNINTVYFTTRYIDFRETLWRPLQRCAHNHKIITF